MKFENMTIPGVGIGMMGYDEDDPDTIKHIGEVIKQLAHKKAALELQQAVKRASGALESQYLCYSNSNSTIRTAQQAVRGALSVPEQSRRRKNKDKNTVYVVIKHARVTRRGDLEDARIYGVYKDKKKAWEKEGEIESRYHLDDSTVDTLRFSLKKGEYIDY